MTESSEGHKAFATFTSVTTERNRLISWDSNVQGLNRPGGVTPSPKSSITARKLGFVIKVTKLIFEFLAELPYAFFKFGYEIAKLFTRVLSRVRLLLSGSKTARQKAHQ